VRSAAWGRNFVCCRRVERHLGKFPAIGISTGSKESIKLGDYFQTRSVNADQRQDREVSYRVR
jgi:hypothetical protein